MIDRKDVGSWLEGPRDQVSAGAYPGERLGRPQHGPGSVARFGVRFVAVLIDWGIALLISIGLFGVTFGQTGPKSFITLAVFAVMHLVLVFTAGSMIGHRIMGLRVVGLDGERVTFVQALARTVLLCMFFPAVFWDRDGRGLHDRAPNTVIVRTR